MAETPPNAPPATPSLRPDGGSLPPAWLLLAAGVGVLLLVIWLQLPGWAGFVIGAALVSVAAARPLRRAQAAQRMLARLREEHAADAGRARATELQNRRLRELMDAVDEPIIGANAAGVVVVSNRAAAELLGIPVDRLVGRPISDVFTQADVVRMHAAAQMGDASHQQVRFNGPDGARTMDVSAIALPPAAGPGRREDAAKHPVVLTLRDVTELDLAVQVKSDFVANASHELRTPIAAIKAAVETLAGGAMQDPPMRQRLVSMIAANAERLHEMVRDLLDISRLESPDSNVQVGPISPPDLVAVLAPMFEGICAERGLSLRFDFDPELDRLASDRNLLILILKNLVENSTRFAYGGTEILITGQPLPAAAGPAARPTPGQARRGVRFEVTDRGAGIPLAHQVRIFERYYQVDSARTGTAPRRGTGLGLSIVKHAVRNLGGSVRVSSVWKQGTTMTVDLPGCLPAASHEPERPAGPGGPDPQSSGR